MGRRIGGLGLVNYKDHPADNRYKVFNFNSIEEARYFEELLTEQTLWFEKDEEEVDSLSALYFSLIYKPDKKGVMYLFAVNQRDFDKVQKLNYLVTAKYRNFSIKNSFLRWVLVLVFLAFVTLAVIGYFKS